MNRVTIDYHTSTQFGGLSQPVEVFDEGGNLLGHFVPKVSLELSASCPYFDEELARMRNEKGGRFLREVWDSIQNE